MFVLSKTSSTAKDENHPVEISLRASVRLLGSSVRRTVVRDLGENFLNLEMIRKHSKLQDDSTELQEY